MTDEQFRVLCAAPLDTSSRDALRAEAIRARDSERVLSDAMRKIHQMTLGEDGIFLEMLNDIADEALRDAGVEVESHG